MIYSKPYLHSNPSGMPSGSMYSTKYTMLPAIELSP
jgi:hypothetical protein